MKPFVYKTDILSNGWSLGVTFDDNYKVYLKDERFGKVYIRFENWIEDYMVWAEFKKAWKTEFILENPDWNKEIFEIDIKNNTFDINKK